jgi:hypothetical protein
MSVNVSLSKVSVTNLGSCNVGTVTPATDNSIKASSTAFVVNLVSYLNLIINKVGNIYNASGIKTFVALYLTGGISTDPITIGTTNASAVDILPASATVGTQTLTINGFVSGLQSTFAGNKYTYPVVTPSVNNRFITGVNQGTTAGSVYTFSALGFTPFSAGCTPVFISNGTNNIARNAGAINVTNTGFTLYATATQTVTWVAFGF